MIHGYNSVQELWRKRNEIERPIREKIIQQHSTESYAYVTLEQAVECVGKADLSVLIDITEKVIRQTDDLLVELDDFVANFPVYAKTRINLEIIRNYGSVLNYSKYGNKVPPILRKSQKADYSLVTELFGLTTDQLEERYSTGYEDIP